jgi:putative chitinase
MALNRKVFYDFVRNLPFGGKITPDQFQGLEKILDYKEAKYPDMDVRWLAYMLATVFHETARTMQPVVEYGSQKYLKGKSYWPWIGRGLIQITWEENYRAFGIDKPEDALKWDVALHVLFDGMIKGRFRSDKVGRLTLARFFNAKADQPLKARLIVNGIPKGAKTLEDGTKEPDKASLIAQYHRNFLDALKQAEKAVESPEEVRKPEPKADEPDAPKLSSDPITQVVTGVAGVGGIGALAPLFSSVSTPWALGVVIVLVLALGVFYFLRKQQANATGV